MKKVIISNTCVGAYLANKLKILPYNNPFIGTLIPNDVDYIKLVNNLEYYIKYCKPVLGEPRENSLFSIQNNGKWYKHESINIPYPVIYLDDIEIHCIHDNNNEICLNKFIRRIERFKNIILHDHQIICCFSFSEFINNHCDYQEIINNYLHINYSKLNIHKLFFGPTIYNINNNPNYINNDEWNNIELKRDGSNVLIFNNQPINSEVFLNKINNL
jgi:uncharacterized protein (DUF1919 family)